MKKVIVQITYNKPGKWSQSQIGIICQVPTEDYLRQWKSLRVMLAPPGINIVPYIDLTLENLKSMNWKEVNVGVAPQIQQPVSSDVYTKRKEYALKHYIASTIHRVMGDTIGSIVTCVNNIQGAYNLWDKEQAVVLLSRTCLCTQLIFVGDPQETSTALRELICQTIISENI